MMPRQDSLWTELEARHRWFHVLRQDILDGKVAEVGAIAWAIYCIIKAHTEMDTGSAWPNQATIAKLAGLSVDTVAKATERLIEQGLLRRERVGRHNTYQLIENVALERKEDSVRVAIARNDYVPTEFQAFLSELKAYAKSGVLPAGLTLNINFHVQNNTNCTVNNNYSGSEDSSTSRGASRSSLLRRVS